MNLEKLFKMKAETELLPNKKTVDKHIKGLIHCIFAPIVVPPLYANDKVEDNIYVRITLERFCNLAKYDEFEEEGTDTECMIYISKASFMFPLDKEWAEIYFFLFRKYCESLKIDVSGILPEYEGKSIDSFQEYEIQKMKKWIYKVQKEHLKIRFEAD